MPSGFDWFIFIYIHLGFIAQMAALIWMQSVDDIKQNWNAYRCNPMYMPLSDDIHADFTYCVQNSQSSMMGYLLQPLTYLTGALTNISGQLGSDIDGIRGMMGTIRSFVTEIVQSIFGVFLNVIIEFQRVTIGIKDVVGKLAAIMVTLMYTLDGSVKTMNSAVASPIGQMVTGLSAGHCFSRTTRINMMDGEHCYMGCASVGGLVCDGSRIVAVMHIENPGTETIYNVSGVFVTGSHMVLDKTRGKFVRVADYAGAVRVIDSDMATEPEFCCLITDTHRITIGDTTFWDWEDWRLDDCA